MPEYDSRLYLSARRRFAISRLQDVLSYAMEPRGVKDGLNWHSMRIVTFSEASSNRRSRTNPRSSLTFTNSATDTDN